MIAQQFTGAAAIFAFSTKMLTEANLSLDNARITTLGVGVCYFVFTLPSPYLIERIGQQKISLFQLGGCLFGLALTTVFTALQRHLQYTWASYANIGALLFFMCIYGVGAPIPWMITSEIFTQEYRSVAIGISTFTAWFWAFIISTLYLPFEEAVGVEFSFLPIIGVLAVCIVAMVLLLPETKNKTIDEIVDEFRERKRMVSRKLTQSIIGRIATAPELKTLPEETTGDDDSQHERTSTYGSVRFD